MLVEKEKPVPRAELLQGESRAFFSHSIDPAGDREFRGRSSCDALGQECTRNSDCRELYAVGRCLTTAFAETALLPKNWLVKL